MSNWSQFVLVAVDRVMNKITVYQKVSLNCLAL